MKKLFVKFSMLLILLAMSVNAAWAGLNIEEIFSSLQNLTPEDFFYVQMKVTPSPASAGSVKLTWIDMEGETINAEKFSKDEEPEKYEQFNGMYTQLNPGASGNTNPTEFKADPQLVGTTLLYGEMEVAMSLEDIMQDLWKAHVYVTSYAYFKAEAQPADGWYFDGWSYVDNGLISQLDTLKSNDNLFWPTEENINRDVIFKVVPHNQKGTKYLNPSAVGSAAYDSTFRYAQANFKPVLLTGYRGGKSEIVVGKANKTFDVYVNLEAKKTITVADFANPTFNSSAFSQVGDVVCGVDAETGIPYAKVTVKYTAPDSLTADTFHKAKMTVASKGGSAIDVPLEIRAVAANRSEATLFNADESVAYNGDLLQAIEAISEENQVLRLNKDVDELSLADKTITLDMNGYVASSLVVNGGIVTVKYNKYDEGVTNPGSLTVQSGKVVLNGGAFSTLTINDGATVEQNGATIASGVTNHGALTTTEGVIRGGLTSNGTLTINGGTFRGENALAISGGTANINKGTIVGSAYGVFTEGGTTTIEKYAAIDGATNSVYANGGSVIINNGKFGNALTGTLTLNTGYFKDKNVGVALPEGKKLLNVAAGPEFEEGFRYFLGNGEDALASNVGVCRIGSTSYAKLEDAIAYANNKPKEKDLVILMTNDYTLPAGYYTLPANATIVVPMSDEQTNSNLVVRRTVLPYEKPSQFRRLTFASGVKMEVFGNIEVSCTQHAFDTGNGGYNSNPWGPYGHLVLEEGVKLTLQNGSHIYAWGFITGKGEIDARRGSTVHEMFQMGDWKGGTTSAGMLTDERGVFPVTQYWIQNVEVPTKFHPGSVLTAAAAVSVLSGMVVAYSNDINIVGVQGVHDAMFLLDNEADAENTWVYKHYDNANDLQVYDVNNTAHIGSIVLKLGKLGDINLDMNSAMFKLPITNNMKIHLLSGYMDFTQDTYLLPGAMVEVDKESIVTITKQSDPSVHSGALYLYGAADWDDYIIDNSGGLKFTKAVLYEPIIGGRPAIRPEKKANGQKDATILVHGQFDTADGYVYTSTSGASIISTNEDAGTFTFSIAVPQAGYKGSTAVNYHASGTSISDTPDDFTVAKLRNAEGADPAFAETVGTAEGQSYCYIEGKWTLFTIDQDHKEFMRDNYKGFYAKPAEYVKIIASKDPDTKVISGNKDHTFSDASGQGRLFILLNTKEGYGQWWEVEKKDNLYHCIHPNNDTYYYWDENRVNEFDEPAPAWVEQRYEVTFKNWDGTPLETIGPDETPVTVCSVTYGTELEYLGTTPTREADIDYTYNFTGWSPALGKVTSNITYTATFEAIPRKYTITFCHEGGKVIETQFLTHNEVPACENTPTKAGHYLIWNPAISPVIGDQTYVATWEEELPTEWDVNFVNNAQGELQPASPISINDHPSYTGATPTKENADHTPYSSNDYTYTFWGWSAVIDGVAQQFAAGEELPSPTAPTTYTAVYTKGKKTYTVIFKNENGVIIESNTYNYGDMPVCSATPTKPATAQYSYTFAWTPQIEAITGNVDPVIPIVYQAQFTPTTNRYTVTLRSNIPDACAFTSGAGTYDYGTAITITKSDNPGYTFINWTDGETGEAVSVLPTSVTGDISLVANFEVMNAAYTITWMNGANSLLVVRQNAGTTTYTGALPTKPDGDGYTYTFDGWTIEEDGSGTVYPNGKTPKATEDATYYAHFLATPKEEEPVLESLELGISGEIEVASPTDYVNVTITSDGFEFSSQIFNAGNITINGNADFVLQKSMERLHWYDVAVPWRVDATNGIFLDGSATPAVLGSDIDLYYYDGAVRAAQGKVDACWIPVKAQSQKVLEPGRAYLFILYNTAVDQVTFRKQVGASLLTTETSVAQYDQTTGNDQDAGWNGIANPSLFKAYLNAGTDVAQTINAAGDGYEAISAESYLVVGQPIYVQVAAPKSSVVADHNSYAPAPVRRTNASADPARYQLTITAEGANRHADRLFVQLDEEKEENTYVIGKDLAKFGTSTSSAQMWVERYDAKLCLNTVAPQGDATSFPMTLSAPKAGEYTIAIEREVSTEAYELYLTYDGTAIWNLSESAYTANLNQGADARYGLRIVARTPQICTGVDEAVVNAQGATRKVLVNEKVFIIRGEKVYTIDGQLVK